MMKKIIKKWWFWVIVICIIFVVVMAMIERNQQRQIKETAEKIGESASDFYTGTQEANTHLDEFTYNYETGEVEYRAETVTLEMYNRIKNGMSEEEVVNILGIGEKLSTEGSNTYMITWGDVNITKEPYYNVQIIFNNDTKEVVNKSQIGLK